MTVVACWSFAQEAVVANGKDCAGMERLVAVDAREIGERQNGHGDRRRAIRQGGARKRDAGGGVTPRRQHWHAILCLSSRPCLGYIHQVHGQGLRVKVEKLWSLHNSKLLKVMGETFESLGQVARSLNRESKFGILAAYYVEATDMLASSLYLQGIRCSYCIPGCFR